MKHLLARTAPLLLCAALLFLCSCKKQEEIRTLVYDLQGQPHTVDPQFASGESAATIIANTFEGLTVLTDDGVPQAACAESWKASPDGKTYTFTLREGLFWANGDPLTATDFAFALRRLFGATPSPYVSDYSMLQNADKVLAGELPPSSLGIKTPDSHTLVFTLSTPHSSFPALLARPAAMPCHEEFFREQKGRYGLSPEQTLGNGPFAIEDWSERAVTLSKSKFYRAATGIDGVVLYLDRGDPVQLFREGRSDGALVTFRRLPELESDTGVLNYNQSWVLLLNTAQGTCADPEVRQALVSVLNLDELTALLPRDALPTKGIVPLDAAFLGHPYRKTVGSPNRATPSENPRALLQGALERLGLEDVGRLSLLVSDFPPGPAFGAQLQRSWQGELSAFINMEQLPYEELLGRVRDGKFSIALAPLTVQGSDTIDFLSHFAGWETAPLPDTLTEDASTAATSDATGDTSVIEISDASTVKPDDASVAALLEQARGQTDPALAAAKLLAAEQRLIDDFVVIPLFDAPTRFVLKDGVEGVRYNAVSHTVYFADAVIR